MMPLARIAWISGNVAAACLSGVSLCAGGYAALIATIVVVTLAQSIALAFVDRRLGWWSVSAFAMAAGFSVALSSVGAVLQASPLSVLSPHLGEFAVFGASLVLGAMPGWFVVAIIQALVLRAVGHVPSGRVLLWLPATVFGGVGLDPFGAAAMLAGFSPTPFGAASCDPLGVAGGALAWVGGASWYALVTLVALVAMFKRPTPAANAE